MTRYIFMNLYSAVWDLLIYNVLQVCKKGRSVQRLFFCKKKSFLQCEGTVVAVSAARYDTDYIISRISGDGYALIPY